MLKKITCFLLVFSAIFATSCKPSNHEPTPSTNVTTSSTVSVTPTPSVTMTPTTPPTTYPSFTLPPSGTELSFETIIEPDNLGGTFERDRYTGGVAQVRIFTVTPQTIIVNDKLLSEELNGIEIDRQPLIVQVDYDKYLVIVAFNGLREKIFSTFAIQKIVQDNGTLLVLAHFNDDVPEATVPLLDNSQYQVVKISRAQITQPLITIRLLDETGQERATAYTLPLKGAALMFEIIAGGDNMGGSYEGQSAVRIITQKPLPDEIEGIKPHDQPGLSDIDYTKYFVIIAFNGWRGGITSIFSIQKIIQNNGSIFIIAHFNDSVANTAALQAFNSQYHVVKISRDQVTQTGTITFKLLDETGQVRATATY